jgi:hypothetical protein
VTQRPIVPGAYPSAFIRIAQASASPAVMSLIDFFSPKNSTKRARGVRSPLRVRGLTSVHPSM